MIYINDYDATNAYKSNEMLDFEANKQCETDPSYEVDFAGFSPRTLRLSTLMADVSRAFANNNVDNAIQRQITQR